MHEIEPDELFPSGAPPARRVIDVRAPVEVARGAVPGALALPILDDEERHRVGIRYEEAGQAAAVALGAELTAPHRAARTAAWRAACADAPSAVMCWRGGMRSELARSMIDRTDVPRVRGGYKAVRRHLVAALERAATERRVLVLGGLSGSGKTDWLQALRAGGAPSDVLALDLEGAAGHRGSAFGRHTLFGGEAPPAQQTFEHRLAVELLADPAPLLLLEDESRRIGSVRIPDPLYRRIAEAPLLLLEDDPAARARRIHRDYVAAPSAARGPEAVRRDLEAALERLRRRLGNDAVERMIARLRELDRTDAWGDPEAFAGAIGELLSGYYDPIYRKATAGREVLARGTREELDAWLRTPTPRSA